MLQKHHPILGYGTLIIVALLLIAAVLVGETFFSTEPGQPFEIRGTFNGIGGMAYSSAFTNHNFRMSFLLDGKSTPGIGGYWSGLLPPNGTLVTITSLSGLMKDVVITDDTDRVYKSQGLSLWPGKHQYAYRVQLRTTGKVLCEGKANAIDSFTASQNATCNGKPYTICNTRKSTWCTSGTAMKSLPLFFIHKQIAETSSKHPRPSWSFFLCNG